MFVSPPDDKTVLIGGILLPQVMEYYLLQFLDPNDPFFEQNSDFVHPGPRMYLNRWKDAVDKR